jgi:hypothetical protein
MKAAGKRIKGKRLEKKFAQLIRQYGLDDKAQRRAFSGAVSMVRGRGDILTKLPFSFECKLQEKIKIWEWWEQAESQATMAKPPVLVYSSNFRPIMITMKAETFLDILKELKEYELLNQK